VYQELKLKKAWLISLCLCLLLAGCQPQSDAAWQLAVVGPFSGAQRALGQEMLRAVELYADEVNQTGGVQGRRLEVITFDDQNDPERAQAQARAALASNAIAVIGHRSSQASLAAADIYRDGNLVMMSGSATANAVTRGNPYAFRTVFNNDTQGDFLARYSYRILAQRRAYLVSDGSAYGTSLADAFSARFRSLGGEVSLYQLLEVDNETTRNLASQISQAISDRVDIDRVDSASIDSDGVDSASIDSEGVDSDSVNDSVVTDSAPAVVVLATAAAPAAQLTAALRRVGVDAVIVGGDALAGGAFIDTLNNYVEERRQPGRFSNDIYAASPLLFDIAGETAQAFAERFNARYEEAPNWAAATYYDAAQMVASAIQDLDVSAPLNEQRQALQRALSTIDNPMQAVAGVSGALYFDPNGDPVTLLALGRYQNQQLVSARVQLRALNQPETLTDLPEALASGRVLELGDRYAYRTQVIYTGIELLDVEALDGNQQEATLSFHLWFRFGGIFDVSNVEFTNAVASPRWQLLEQTNAGELNYRLYRVSGTFRLDFLAHSFGEHVLGVQLRNVNASNNNLLYVVDVLGMNLHQGVDPPETPPFSERLTSVYGQRVVRQAFFQDTYAEASLGNPSYLAQGGVGYSRFNAAWWLEPSGIQLRQQLPLTWARWLLLSGGVLLALSLLLSFRHLKPWRPLVWFMRALAAVLLLLAGEVWLIDAVSRWQLFEGALPALVTQAFSLFWWLTPALLLLLAIEDFVWLPLEERTGRSVPSVMRGSVAIIVVSLAAFGIMSFVFEQPLTGVLATSGVLVMVIGLAVQINIANIFSGLAINMEQPFRVGDWVTIDDIETGQVIDITWRTTRLRTPLGNIISIPNSTASDKVVQNYNYPNHNYWMRYTVHVDPSHSPEQVKGLLERAVRACEGVLGVRVFFTGLSEWSAAFWIDFELDDFGARFRYADAVWSNVWRTLKDAGIKPALRDRQRHLYREDTAEGVGYVLEDSSD
jgi:branched-chain amino acid transport system substrate-binding protein